MSESKRSRWMLWPVSLALAVVAVGCASPKVSKQPITPDLAMETYEAADSIVYHTHFDPSFNGVNWDSLRAELRPQVEEVEYVEELREILREMVGSLGQSHFAIITQERADALDPDDSTAVSNVGVVGLDVRLLEDELVVTRVDDGTSADEAGIRLGWIVREIDGEPVAETIETVRELDESEIETRYQVWRRTLGELNGESGTTCEVVMLDGEDNEVSFELERTPTKSMPVRIGNLPTFFSRSEHYPVNSEETGLRVGVVWFNIWMVPLMPQINGAIDEFRDLDGIVVDLRGNGGGVGAMVMGFAGNFFPDTLKLGDFRMREGGMRIMAMPRRVDSDGNRVEPYAGPVAILTDGLSASASEVFAGGMQSVGRSKVFGETTLGAVLPAAMDRLPNGDVLYHAFAEFVTADGVTLEGRGVIPDETVETRREDLLRGTDAPLEAAIRWIAEERQKQTTATGILMEGE